MLKKYENHFHMKLIREQTKEYFETKVILKSPKNRGGIEAQIVGHIFSNKFFVR